MTETFRRWDAAEHLQTGQDAQLYLEACADEDPGDGSTIRAALNDIARTGNMAGLAREVGMSREGLDKALSVDGNPSFTTVLRITRALGMDLRPVASTEPVPAKAASPRVGVNNTSDTATSEAEPPED